MGGYPPGTSRRDLVRAGIIEPHHHECEFLMDDDRANPIIEDGAAIFHLQCRYAEGEYGEKYQCEETKHYRFEYDVLISPSDEEYPVPVIQNWGDAHPNVEAMVIRIEQAFHNGDDDVEMRVDPDPDDGSVELERKGYTLKYAPKN